MDGDAVDVGSLVLALALASLSGIIGGRKSLLMKDCWN